MDDRPAMSTPAATVKLEGIKQGNVAHSGRAWLICHCREG
jgi:hypothetical protein